MDVTIHSQSHRAKIMGEVYWTCWQRAHSPSVSSQVYSQDRRWLTGNAETSVCRRRSQMCPEDLKSLPLAKQDEGSTKHFLHLTCQTASPLFW